ncbi:hypothetical protein J45TS6_35390 [Paenibacillus sp. J45TS6]|nr:hypothetical protein J45TS6_35390 [Paenibacillus sp. J45TS6]
MLNSSLEDHKHCTSFLMEPKKADKFAEFPVICPYAYAYDFWKTSLLKEEKFYCDNLCRSNNTSYRPPLII